MPLPDRLILASASPRRRSLLAEYGIAAEILPADVEEIMPDYLSVGEITVFNARRKALAIAKDHREALVLGVDTLVSLEGHILGKPRDMDEAFSMLSSLSGRTHEVFSGVCLAQSGRVRMFYEVSHVRFHPLSPDRIREYMARIHPLDKAGAYAAQEEDPAVIAEIRGSRTNVIGLPMEALTAALQSW